MDISEPPKGSSIRVQSEADGVRLFWKKPGGGPFRYFVAIFLVAWLCGWAVALVASLRQLLTKEGPQGFLILWLAGWTLGGVFAGAMLWKILRPQKPESVTLGWESFKYDTGSAPSPFMNPFYYMMRRGQMWNPFASLFKRRKMYEFHKARCPRFILEGLGSEQRLRFDDGAERVVIGEALREPEREWLAAVLDKWVTG